MADRKQDNKTGRFDHIAKAFRIPGEITSARRITKGRINTAYCVTVEDGGSSGDYLFQRVNTFVFSDPESLMRNISLITEHIASKADPSYQTNCLRFRKTSDDALFYTIPDTGECWRVSNYIGNSVSFEPVEADERALYMIGKAYGKFNRDLADFDASKLTETIPHFHDTDYRLRTLNERIEEDPLGRADSAANEIHMICDLAEKSQPMLETIRCLLEQPDLLAETFRTSNRYLHATHNDTKINNVLLDKNTLEPLAVIDLDTCMPGLYCYDFGDMIRSAAATGDEEWTANDTNAANGPTTTSVSVTDNSRISFDLSRFRACTEGYMSEMRGIIKERELESLPCGMIAVTLELAARFLEDYLSGDTYFRIDRPGQNLDRARTQLYLLDDMLSKFEKAKC